MPATLGMGVSQMTAAEFCERFLEHRMELVQGIPVELPMPHARHGFVCNWIAFFLTQYILTHDTGRVLTHDTLFLLQAHPPTLRGPDVAFVSYAKLPRGPLPEGLLDLVPELAIEVKSPSETWSAVFHKALEYLDAGVMVVVVLDPDTNSASVYRSDARQETFEKQQALEIPDLFPGLSIPLSRVFPDSL